MNYTRHWADAASVSSFETEREDGRRGGGREEGRQGREKKRREGMVLDK